MVLRIHALAKAYRETRAVDAISFAAQPRTLTVLLGPAGAGKTTTLRLIAGLEDPDCGTVQLAGRDVTFEPPNRRNVAMIFDNLALYPDRSGFENIASPLRIARLAETDLRRRVAAVASMLRVEHVLDRKPRTMSGGERQRIALGRALVRDPAIFLLDEPLSSLDAMLRLELRAELRRLQSERGYSFLMATPDFAEALAIADRVIVLRKGQIAQIAGPQELYAAPADRDVARLVGAPPINIFPAHIEGGPTPQLRFGAHSIAAPPSLLRNRRGPAIEVGVRPEDVILGDPGDPSLAAKVIDVEPLGLRSTITVKTGGVDLVASVPGDHTLHIGDQVGVTFRAAMLHGFDPTTGARL